MISPRGASPIGSSSRPTPLLVLASESPRRKALLESIGVHPQAITPANVDETPLKNELPRLCAARLAKAKAAAAAERWTGEPALILAADTIVACGRRMLPKAANEDDVRACLRLLHGRSHQVITAVAVLVPGGRMHLRIVDTRVTFGRLSPESIESYAESGEGIGKAGGYAIQGRADMFTLKISGSYSNVVGLPLYQTAQLLKGCGCLLP